MVILSYQKVNNTMTKVQKRKNKIHAEICLRVFLLVLLSSFWIPALTQANDGPSSGTDTAHIKRNKDQNSSRVLPVNEISTKTKMPDIQFSACQAYISTDVQQRNTLARVIYTIEDKQCTTSTGEYEVLVIISDENGVSRNLSFSETWEQKDNSVTEFSRDYPIGENVTLKRVMVQRIRCECAAPSLN